jgi:hypothetical protein
MAGGKFSDQGVLLPAALEREFPAAHHDGARVASGADGPLFNPGQVGGQVSGRARVGKRSADAELDSILGPFA